MKKSALLFVTMALAVLLATSGVAWAAAGNLDKTFGGGDGKVADTSRPHGTDVRIAGVEVLPSNKIAALTTNTLYSYDELIRYNEDGFVDMTFGGGDGEVTSKPSQSFLSPYYWADLLRQPDGKLVVAGVGEGPDPNFSQDLFLYRFNSDGSVDETFGGGDGVTVVSFGKGIDAFASEMGLQGDKIVVVGYRAPQPGQDNDALVVRFAKDGSVDKTFGGGDGRVLIDVGGKHNYASDVAVLGEGKLLVAGHKEETEGQSYVYDFTLARLHPNGSLDLSFGGGDGKVVTDFGGGDTASALVVRQGGRPVVVGTTRISSESSAFALAAYTSDGSPDPKFGGGDGQEQTLQTRFSTCPEGEGGGVRIADAVKQADDKIIVVGSACVDYYGGEFFALARYLPTSGELDQTFGDGDGTVVTRFFNYLGADALAADIGGDGRLVVGGKAVRVDPEIEEPAGNAALARYLLE